MSDLTILNTSVRQLDNLYSLNDLHRVSGSEDKHAPFRFMRNEQTQELISEIQKDFGTPDLVFQIKRGKNIQGTYACEELALAYATWISPKFHLVVLRAFIAMHRGEVAQHQLALPNPEKTFNITLTEDELRSLAWLWKAAERMRNILAVLYKPVELMGSKFSGAVYGSVTEYKRTLEQARKIIVRETATIETDKWDINNWNNVLHELRQGELRSSI
ncbi:bacteriocin [Muribacter muris]|uniref:Bacteriocin n=1 Tax=Muribacter muris TaxID=67855 RepID=A0A4Y9JV37_9PAST|nr:KilA-N domain-containing protein [Muribacter muris]MBF0785758.1 KilA-N domain-containing protein [Muribacter muris]MBF0828270.1 KilA-N domain-containing protein [Muribacter muris]TFV08580.1 bacteriocin [Muribacter muris]